MSAKTATPAPPVSCAATPAPAAATYARVGERLGRFQEQLAGSGSSLQSEIAARYLDKWRSESLSHVLRVRTALLSGMQDFLIERGLLNLERVQMSLVTDPLAHDVEHLPVIGYRGSPYVATHSMIYAKFLACHNPHIKGIFVDSPNMRLELPEKSGGQRGKYLIDFSQLDVEVRRNRKVQLDAYLDQPEKVAALLREDLAAALAFFEGMARAGFEKVKKIAGDSLAALGVTLDVPAQPFPVFYLDEALAKYPKAEVEARLGEQTDAPAFFVVGLMRENYDLIYPYLRRDGTRRKISEFSSREIYNYDLCVKGKRIDGQPAPAIEVLSGAIREWLPEAIIARLLDNGVIPEAPVFKDGHLENLDALGGYGPFLSVACRREADGTPGFPDTFGAGIGIERLLYALLRGPQVERIDDVTFFGKNPDSAELFLF
jgi:aspartyl/asparaginyl-tRNA synthetase